MDWSQFAIDIPSATSAETALSMRVQYHDSSRLMNIQVCLETLIVVMLSWSSAFADEVGVGGSIGVHSSVYELVLVLLFETASVEGQVYLFSLLLPAGPWRRGLGRRKLFSGGCCFWCRGRRGGDAPGGISLSGRLVHFQ